MSLELHPDATLNFNAKGADLASHAIIGTPVRPPHRGFQPDYHVVATVTEKDLKPDAFIWSELRTPLGEPHGVTVSRNRRTVSLDRQYHEALDQLAAAMCKARPLRDLIAPTELAKIIAEWVWVSQSEQDAPPLTTYALREVESLVKDHEVWLPIFGVAIERDFKLAGVELRTVSRELIDDLCERMIAHEPPEEVHIAQVRAEGIRKRLQGIAAVVTTVRAEINRAVEIAVSRTAGPLTILRFSSPAALVPQIRSYVALLGAEDMVRRLHFTTEGGRIAIFSESFETTDQTSVALSKARIAELLKGLRYFDRLFALEEPNDFQQAARSALEIFGRGTLYRSISEKLLHFLIALESLLLRNDSEPIQENLGWRIAYAHNCSAEERLEKLAVVRAAYSLRSKFLHHGVSIRPDPEDLKTLEKFMKISFMFLFEIPRFAFGCDRRDTFLDMIDKRRAGGA